MIFILQLTGLGEWGDSGERWGGGKGFAVGGDGVARMDRSEECHLFFPFKSAEVSKSNRKVSIIIR